MTPLAFRGVMGGSETFSLGESTNKRRRPSAKKSALGSQGKMINEFTFVRLK